MINLGCGLNDYSKLSVEKAAEYNKAAIHAGRCIVLQGDVSDLARPWIAVLARK